MSRSIIDRLYCRYQRRARRTHPLWLVLMTGLLLLSSGLINRPALLAQSADPRAGQGVQVSDYLQGQLRTAQGPVSFLIVLREQVDANAALARAQLRNGSRTAKAALIYHELTATAQRTQAPLRAWLEAQGIPYRAFYLVNMIEVQGDARLVDALRQRPEVQRLIANPKIDQGLHRLPQAPTFTILDNKEAQATPARPYGLDYTHAPEVWALGYQGQGIVVASQDTGVEWDHPALKAAYRGVITSTVTVTSTEIYLPLIHQSASVLAGNHQISSAMAGTITTTIITSVTHPYNWYDAWGIDGRPARCVKDAQVPCDDDGHGTHTVGTMLGDATASGDTVLGMAPNAKWIGCRNMIDGVGTPASYTACFEFFMAPYPQGGNAMTDGRPELAPHIINNSWGCPPSEGCDADSLRQVVETVRAAGLMVVASAGNNGSSCATVDDPIAIYDAVFSVGAHNSGGTIAGFSSRGAVTVDGSGRMKPDISAPGVAVRSSWVNESYNTIQGTSMASPHVAGAAALLWSAVPDLIGDIDMTEQVLIKSATAVPFNQCGEDSTAVTPNNTYGYGRLNVLAAVQLAQQPATLALTITEAISTNIPITLTDDLTEYSYTATTGADGVARFILYAGNYRITLNGMPATPSSVTLIGNEQKQVAVRRAEMVSKQ